MITRDFDEFNSEILPAFCAIQKCTEFNPISVYNLFVIFNGEPMPFVCGDFGALKRRQCSGCRRVRCSTIVI